MDLRFTRRFFCLDSTLNSWSYGDWAAMSGKTTTLKGREIGSGRTTEELEGRLEGKLEGKFESIASDALAMLV